MIISRNTGGTSSVSAGDGLPVLMMTGRERMVIMQKEYDSQLREKLEDFIRSVTSQNKAAAAIGVSATMLSQYRAGKYTGDVEQLESKLREFFENTEAAKKISRAAVYAETSVSKGVYQTIRLCHLRGGLAVEAGDAGIGKTMAAKKYVEDYPNSALYIAVNPCTSGISAFLKAFARALHIDQSGRKYDLWERINSTLLGSKRVLIIDESQHLPVKTIETIRSFCDQNKDFGVAMIGNINSLCNNNKPGYEQIRSRTKLTSTRHTSNITRDDVKLLFPDAENKAVDFLHKITQTEQGVRGAVNLYNNAADNGNVTYEGLLAMAKAAAVMI